MLALRFSEGRGAGGGGGAAVPRGPHTRSASPPGRPGSRRSRRPPSSTSTPRRRNARRPIKVPGPPGGVGQPRGAAREGCPPKPCPGVRAAGGPHTAQRPRAPIWPHSLAPAPPPRGSKPPGTPGAAGLQRPGLPSLSCLHPCGARLAHQLRCPGQDTALPAHSLCPPRAWQAAEGPPAFWT